MSLAPLRERVEEVGWVVDYLPDLEADFLAHYGVRDMLALTGPQWLRLAARTVAYAGVMQARAQSLLDAEDAAAPPAGPPAPGAPTGGGRAAHDVTVVGPSRVEIESAAPLAGLIEWSG